MKKVYFYRHMLRLLFVLLVCTAWVHTETVQADTDRDIAVLRHQGKVFSRIAKEAKDAVVFIQVEKKIKVGEGAVPYRFNDPFNPFNDDFFERFFRHRSPRRQRQPKREFRQQGQGSGFVISRDGYILTNNHVVEGADTITVKLNDGRELKAEIVGTDPQTDVAVIKVKGDSLPVLPLGSSHSLEVGEWVMAIGNPFGLAQTVTVGVVSAKGRSGVGIVDYEDFIQTDAAINPGNSGGPLLNLEGRAVGINTAIFSKSGGYMGIGFAIPIDMAKKIYTQLIDKGSISRGFLGVVIQNITPALAKSFGLEKTEGVLISQVNKDSAAEKAGLSTGDVIVKFDGTPVKKVGPFRNRVALSAPGSKHTVIVVRNGKEKTVTVKLGTLESGHTAQAPSKAEDTLGLTVQNLTPELAERLGYETDSGVIITGVEPGSAAAAAGLTPGILILEVNKKPVKNTSEFHDAAAAAVKAKKNILLLVKEKGYSRFVVIRLADPD